MRIVLLCLALMTASLPAKAAELVMFDTEGCYWCLRWKEEVGRYYGKTREAGIAPLRRVDLRGRRPADLPPIRGVALTPTFVVVDRGREIGRIVGYPGEKPFWAMLGRILSGGPAAR